MAKKDRIRKKRDESNVIHGLAGSLEAAFSEDVSELEEDDVIIVEVPEKSGRTKHNRILYFLIGFIIIVFAIVGIVNTVIAAKDLISDIADNTALRNEFTLYLYPVVATDPPTFENADTLQNSTIIRTAISKILLTSDLSNYESDTGVLYIPEFDVETAAKSIFGTGITIEHETVGNVQDRATYSTEKKAYGVANSTATPNYIPKITDMTNVGETFTLKVEYYPLSVDIPGLENKATSVKTMTYVIARSGEKMTITSIALDSIANMET